jgi:hypothetical protein
MLRKYGTGTDQQIMQVDNGTPETDALIAKTAADQWTDDDERDLRDETEEK